MMLKNALRMAFSIGTLSLMLILPTAPELMTPIAQASDCPIAFEENQICASLEWITPPTIRKDSPFLLKLWTRDRRPLPGQLEVAIDLWMPDMNHGSAPVRIEKRSAGEILVRNVYFIMPGYWQVRIRLKTGSDFEENIVEIHL